MSSRTPPGPADSCGAATANNRPGTLPVPVGRLALVGHDTAWWAYDAATGEPRWRGPCDGALADDPVVRDGMLYGPTTEGVRAVRL